MKGCVARKISESRRGEETEMERERDNEFATPRLFFSIEGGAAFYQRRMGSTGLLKDSSAKGGGE